MILAAFQAPWILVLLLTARFPDPIEFLACLLAKTSMRSLAKYVVHNTHESRLQMG